MHQKFTQPFDIDIAQQSQSGEWLLLSGHNDALERALYAKRRKISPRHRKIAIRKSVLSVFFFFGAKRKPIKAGQQAATTKKKEAGRQSGNNLISMNVSEKRGKFFEWISTRIGHQPGERRSKECESSRRGEIGKSVLCEKRGIKIRKLKEESLRGEGG